MPQPPAPEKQLVAGQGRRAKSEFASATNSSGQSGAWTCLFLKGSVRHQVDGRRRSVSGYIAFAEVPDEVVVSRLRLRLGDVTETPDHAPLHVEPRELLNDPCDLCCRDELVLQADHIQADAGGTERHLRLLVEADRRCRVEGDAVPNELGSALVDTTLPREDTGQVGAFDLE